jgi:hypothetical protein
MIEFVLMRLEVEKFNARKLIFFFKKICRYATGQNTFKNN